MDYDIAEVSVSGVDVLFSDYRKCLDLIFIQTYVTLQHGVSQKSNPQSKRNYMGGFRQSSAQATIEYQTEPAIVAQTVQDVLARIGKVTNVSRETGTISGKISVGWLEDKATAIISLSKKGDSTELNIQTSKVEPLLTGDGSGAQRAIIAFMEAMGQDKRLVGKSTGRW